MNLEQKVLEISLTDIIPNRFQPRLNFDEQALIELADSIKQHGIIQPLVLRQVGDKYEIVAGERRYKAAEMAGLTKVPAILANIDDNASAEVALVENIQRKDLTPIEEARSYKNILDRGYMTQDELAKKLGASQSAISNKLRLLNLDEEIQKALLEGKISERHARSLLQIQDKEEQKKWLDRIINERMTVRQLDMELKNNVSGDAEGDIPVVDITPDVEQIKNSAQDIIPKEEEKLKEDLFAEQVGPIEIQPVEIADVAKVEQQQRKFFNFLESEGASLNTEETPVSPNPISVSPVAVEPVVEAPSAEMPQQTTGGKFSNFMNNIFFKQPVPSEEPVVPTVEIAPPVAEEVASPVIEPTVVPMDAPVEVASVTEPIAPVVPIEPVVSVTPTSETLIQEVPTEIKVEPVVPPVSAPAFEMPLPKMASSEPLVETPAPEPTPEVNVQEIQASLTPSDFSVNNEVVYEPEPQVETNVVDPVSMIERLAPDYEQQVKVEAGLDLTSAISSVRANTSSLMSRGFNIDTEEADLPDKYIITITIQKDNENA